MSRINNYDNVMLFYDIIKNGNFEEMTESGIQKEISNRPISRERFEYYFQNEHFCNDSNFNSLVDNYINSVENPVLGFICFKKPSELRKNYFILKLDKFYEEDDLQNLNSYICGFINRNKLNFNDIFVELFENRLKRHMSSFSLFSYNGQIYLAIRKQKETNVYTNSTFLLKITERSYFNKTNSNELKSFLNKKSVRTSFKINEDKKKIVFNYDSSKDEPDKFKMFKFLGDLKAILPSKSYKTDIYTREENLALILFRNDKFYFIPRYKRLKDKRITMFDISDNDSYFSMKSQTDLGFSTNVMDHSYFDKINIQVNLYTDNYEENDEFYLVNKKALLGNFYTTTNLNEDYYLDWSQELAVTKNLGSTLVEELVPGENFLYTNRLFNAGSVNEFYGVPNYFNSNCRSYYGNKNVINDILDNIFFNETPRLTYSNVEIIRKNNNAPNIRLYPGSDYTINSGQLAITNDSDSNNFYVKITDSILNDEFPNEIQFIHQSRENNINVPEHGIKQSTNNIIYSALLNNSFYDKINISTFNKQLETNYYLRDITFTNVKTDGSTISNQSLAYNVVDLDHRTLLVYAEESESMLTHHHYFKNRRSGVSVIPEHIKDPTNPVNKLNLETISLGVLDSNGNLINQNGIETFSFDKTNIFLKTTIPNSGITTDFINTEDFITLNTWSDTNINDGRLIIARFDINKNLISVWSSGVIPNFEEVDSLPAVVKYVRISFMFTSPNDYTFSIPMIDFEAGPTRKIININDDNILFKTGTWSYYKFNRDTMSFDFECPNSYLQYSRKDNLSLVDSLSFNNLNLDTSTKLSYDLVTYEDLKERFNPNNLFLSKIHFPTNGTDEIDLNDNLLENISLDDSVAGSENVFLFDSHVSQIKIKSNDLEEDATLLYITEDDTKIETIEKTNNTYDIIRGSNSTLMVVLKKGTHKKYILIIFTDGNKIPVVYDNQNKIFGNILDNFKVFNSIWNTYYKTFSLYDNVGNQSIDEFDALYEDGLKVKFEELKDKLLEIQDEIEFVDAFTDSDEIILDQNVRGIYIRKKDSSGVTFDFSEEAIEISLNKDIFDYKKIYTLSSHPSFSYSYQDGYFLSGGTTSNKYPYLQSGENWIKIQKEKLNGSCSCVLPYDTYFINRINYQYKNMNTPAFNNEKFYVNRSFGRNQYKIKLIGRDIYNYYEIGYLI